MAVLVYTSDTLDIVFTGDDAVEAPADLKYAAWIETSRAAHVGDGARVLTVRALGGVEQILLASKRPEGDAPVAQTLDDTRAQLVAVNGSTEPADLEAFWRGLTQVAVQSLVGFCSALNTGADPYERAREVHERIEAAMAQITSGGAPAGGSAEVADQGETKSSGGG